MAIVDTVNALIEAVEALERELGILPSSVYADVRVRLDVLEARINNPFAPSPTVENPFIIGNDGVTISTGVGVPVTTPVPGSIYLRQDGYAGADIYSYRPDGYWHVVGDGGSTPTIFTVDGTAAAGAGFSLLNTGNNFTTQNGFSYDIELRILVVNKTGSPTCSRYVYNVLAHTETGTLTLDVINTSLSDELGTGWTVTLGTSGIEFTIQVDASGSDDRTATGTIEWREISRA